MSTERPDALLTTAMVREGFAWEDGYPWSGGEVSPEREAAFDRWLAAHDREVSERAWDRGWDNRDEGTRETDDEAMYHYSRLNNPYAEPERWLAVERGAVVVGGKPQETGEVAENAE